MYNWLEFLRQISATQYFNVWRTPEFILRTVCVINENVLFVQYTKPVKFVHEISLSFFWKDFLYTLLEDFSSQVGRPKTGCGHSGTLSFPISLSLLTHSRQKMVPLFVAECCEC